MVHVHSNIGSNDLEEKSWNLNPAIVLPLFRVHFSGSKFSLAYAKLYDLVKIPLQLRKFGLVSFTMKRYPSLFLCFTSPVQREIWSFTFPVLEHKKIWFRTHIHLKWQMNKNSKIYDFLSTTGTYYNTTLPPIILLAGPICPSYMIWVWTIWV